MSLCHACHQGGVTKCQTTVDDVTKCHPVPSVPRLPRKTTVDVSLCHACHANDYRCEFVPRLPRDIKVDVTKCQTTVDDVTKCHACVCVCEVIVY